MKKSFFLLMALISVMFLTGCAKKEIVEYQGYEYGFLEGFWHGVIIPFSFLGELFYNDVAIYAVNNSGVSYDFGFLFGVLFLGVLTAQFAWALIIFTGYFIYTVLNEIFKAIFK